MNEVIKIDSVKFAYSAKKDHIKALKGVSFNVKKSEVFGFIGPNGAGKTTLIKLLLGILKQDSGSITILDKDPKLPLSRSSLGYMPEIANYSPLLTPRELLSYYGTLCRIPNDVALERSEDLLKTLGLQDRADDQMKSFSKGMMQKVSFAQALINDPDILILDEPASGLDPLARTNIRRILSELREKGKTIFFSSHELSEVELICDRVALLNEGQLISCGTTEELMQNKGVEQSLERYFLDMIGG